MSSSKIFKEFIEHNSYTDNNGFVHLNGIMYENDVLNIMIDLQKYEENQEKTSLVIIKSQ